MTTKELIKLHGVQGIVDYVSTYRTTKEGIKKLSISSAAFSQIQRLVNSDNKELIKSVDSLETPLYSANDIIGGKQRDPDDPLRMLSDKAREIVGDAGSRVQRTVRWGLVDIELYIDSYLTQHYMKRTQDKALKIHFWLMYEGHESNYLQMLGIHTQMELFMAVNGGKITKKNRETLKNGIYCQKV